MLVLISPCCVRCCPSAGCMRGSKSSKQRQACYWQSLYVPWDMPFHSSRGLRGNREPLHKHRAANTRNYPTLGEPVEIVFKDPILHLPEGSHLLLNGMYHPICARIIILVLRKMALNALK